MTSDIANIIDGARRAPTGKSRYRRLSPVDGTEVLAEYPLSTAADVEAAVDAARRVARSFANSQATWRGEILAGAARLLRERQDEAASLLIREIGKTRTEAKGETLAAIRLLEFYGNEAFRYGGELLSSARPDNHLFTRRRPLGVCGLVTPWNYPLSIPAWKLGPALLCGNTTVFKPSLQHPLSSQLIVEVLESAGLPPGVVNLVHGDGEVAGAAIVDHPDVAAVSFTGSRAVGESIYRSVNGRLGRASCEMGGKNALVVLADADLDVAVECAVDGGLSFAGQKCTGTDRVIVERAILDEFADKLVERVSTLVAGDLADDNVFVSPLVDDHQLRRVESIVSEGIAQGAELICGGAPSAIESGYYFPPTVLANINPDSRIAHDEVFGPVLALYPADDLDSAITQVNDTSYGLSASICTRSLSHAHRFVDAVATGLAYVNRPTSGAEFHAPFGGIRGSGLGPTEQGRKVLEFYSHWQTVAMRL